MRREDGGAALRPTWQSHTLAAMEVGFRPGAVLLEKYRVESVLGRGGMGVVLRVTHLHLGEELALKILSPEAAVGPDVHARFLREAQSAVRLRGEHVTRVSDVGMLPEGAPYIVMEYLRGVDLAGELERRGMLPPGEVVDYVLQACEALAEAHSLGIVHRDIKPSNLFLTYRPDGSALVKVLDFGISKAPIAGPGLLTRTDTVMGTPGYMSPEQMKASKDVDARTDIWALGIVLYECLNGRRPFDAESFSAIVLRAATETPPPMDPRVHRGLQMVVLRCLEKDRAARFQSIAELTAALAPFARDVRAASIIVERTSVMLRSQGATLVPVVRYGQPPTATTLSGSAGMLRQRPRRRQYAIGGAALLLAAIVVVSVVRSSRSSHPGGPEGGSTVRDAGSASDVVVVQGLLDAAVDTSPTVSADQAADHLPDAAQMVAVPPTSEDAMAATVKHPPPAGNLDSDKARQKAAHCQELEAKRDWQKLRDCAGELAVLGAKDKRGHRAKELAEAFLIKARKEASNEAAASEVQSALQKEDLPEAQKHLKTITPDSVYLTKTTETFRTAELQAIDENRHKAVALANAHDCRGLKRFQDQIGVTSTSAVAAEIAAVQCMELIAAAPPGDPTPVGTPSGSSALPNTTSLTVHKDPTCDKMDVDDVIEQAGHQFGAGFAKAALQLMNKALVCRQDVRMYRMAAMYACAARDAANAKLYFAKLPVQYQSAIAQRCQGENVSFQ